MTINVEGAYEALRDQTLREAVSSLKDKYKDQWVLATTTADRESLHSRIILLDQVMDELNICLTNYKYQ